MIRIGYEDLVNKIIEKTGYTRETVENLINQKVKQLSGLITKDGAAHIVANELGIKLFDKVSGRLKIKNILLGMRDVETVGVVRQNFGVREFSTNNRQGKVASLIIADETGSVRVVFWNEIADTVNKIKVGDTIKIVAGYVRGRNDNKEIHLNNRSKVLINPPDEKIDLANLKQSYVRKTIEELKDTDRQVELRLTIVQVFEPRFYEICPECGRKVTLKEGGFFCDVHGKVTPKHAYVINLLGDDGTGTIRLVFFRDTVLKVLGKSEDELLVYKENAEKFDELRTDLLGTEIIVRGRVNVNKMFGRKEFIVEDVSKPDYKSEQKIIESKIDELPPEVKDVNVDEVLKERAKLDNVEPSLSAGSGLKSSHKEDTKDSSYKTNTEKSGDALSDTKEENKDNSDEDSPEEIEVEDIINDETPNTPKSEDSKEKDSE